MWRCRPTASAHGSPPSRRAVPESAFTTPSSTRIVVDFPAPLGPRKPCTSPSRTVSSRPSRARTAPKVFVRFRISIGKRLLSTGIGFSFLFGFGKEGLVHVPVGHQAVCVELEGGDRKSVV